MRRARRGAVCIDLSGSIPRMWHDFAIACCLVLVIEGIMPFLSPSAWRSMLLAVAQVDDRRLRIAGTVCDALRYGAAIPDQLKRRSQESR
jgi:uncharacterized protein YjeT (DUF2065 family)